jgi:hypothetical protein
VPPPRLPADWSGVSVPRSGTVSSTNGLRRADAEFRTAGAQPIRLIRDSLISLVICPNTQSGTLTMTANIGYLFCLRPSNYR